MLFSGYEISESGYGIRVQEKIWVIAQNLQGQVPDIIFENPIPRFWTLQYQVLGFQKTGDSGAYTFLIDSYQGLE